MKAYEYWNKHSSNKEMIMLKPKKRGRKPGVKYGPYRKTKLKNLSDDGLENLTKELETAIKARIKVLNSFLKRIK